MAKVTIVVEGVELEGVSLPIEANETQGVNMEPAYGRELAERQHRAEHLFKEAQGLLARLQEVMAEIGQLPVG